MSTVYAKRLPPVAPFTRALLNFFMFTHYIWQLCSRINSRFYATYQILLRPKDLGQKKRNGIRLVRGM